MFEQERHKGLLICLSSLATMVSSILIRCLHGGALRVPSDLVFRVCAIRLLNPDIHLCFGLRYRSASPRKIALHLLVSTDCVLSIMWFLNRMLIFSSNVVWFVSLDCDPMAWYINRTISTMRSGLKWIQKDVAGTSWLSRAWRIAFACLTYIT